MESLFNKFAVLVPVKLTDWLQQTDSPVNFAQLSKTLFTPPCQGFAILQIPANFNKSLFFFPLQSIFLLTSKNTYRLLSLLKVVESSTLCIRMKLLIGSTNVIFQRNLEFILVISAHYIFEYFIWILECQEKVWSFNSLYYTQIEDPLNNFKKCNEIYVYIVKIVEFLALVIALAQTFNRGFSETTAHTETVAETRRVLSKGLLKNFPTFTGKQLCWSPFLIKL